VTFLRARSIAGPSLAALVALACAGCGPGSPPPGEPTAASPGAAGTAAPEVARPLGFELVDIAERSGIAFRHVTGAFGDKLLPETMGSGAAFLDFDGDGKLDVFLVNSSWWPGREPSGPAPACALYRGRGDGTFEDVTAAAGAGISLYGMGAAVADHDGDGDDDIYVTGVFGNALLRNDGGVFRDVARQAGVAGGTWKDPDGKERPEWSTAAAWVDVDIDGDVDLVVANYVEWCPENEIFTTIDGVTKAFTTPDRYRGLPCRLFLNQGRGKFTDATVASGLAGLRGKALGIAVWDFDGNRLPDLVVANDTQPNFLFMNRGGGRFEEIGLEAGIAYDETGRARAGMGIDIQDHANDGIPAVAIGNFSEEPMSLYRWSPPVRTGESGGFTSEAARAGLAGPTYKTLAFGVLFIDVDLDGADDLVIANGHIEPDVARVFQGQTHAQSPQLFLGRGDGTFTERTLDAGKGFSTPRVGRGLAAGDVDGDGDLDILITVNGGAPALLENVRQEGARNHFLRVRLRGRGENTKALGATVRLVAGGTTRTRLARTGSSYLSQSEATLTFGLGGLSSFERLTVEWPSGAETVVPGGAADRTIEVVEDAPR
jgi:hypothetical protein